MSASEITLNNTVATPPVLGTGFINLQGNGTGATLSPNIPISWVQYPNFVVLTIHAWSYNIGGSAISTNLEATNLPPSIIPTYNLVNEVKLNINGTDNFLCTCEIDAGTGLIGYHNSTNTFTNGQVVQTANNGTASQTFIYS